MRLNPFAALRPIPELAAEVASVPYDVVDRGEAAALADGCPHSFLHVIRAEIDLPEDLDPYDERVYHTARANLARLVEDGILQQDEAPAMFAYRLQMGDHSQIGVVGCVHIDDYEQDVIKKHEKTRPAKENDRTRHILTLRADAEPVLLTYRDDATVDALVADAIRDEPLYDFTAPDGVHHTLWRLPNHEAVTRAFDAVPCCYVADGHHRCASAWRAGRERREQQGDRATGAEPYHWFPAVLFPASQLNILAYQRVVLDLGETDPDALLEALRALGDVRPTTDPVPPAAGSVALYFGSDRGWHLLTFAPDSIDRRDPIASLDCALLQDRVLGPLLGIEDPRTDARLDFVGGIRGTGELERRVDGGRARLAVSMHPTTVEQLLDVADAGAVMPPKSTWFEPKLRSGLFVHRLD